MALDLFVRRPWLKWVFFALFWTLLGLAFAGQLYLTQSKIGNPVTWRYAAGRSLADWYVFGVLSVPALWLARRFRLEGPRWPWSLAVHFLAGTVFSVAWMALRALVEQFQAGAGPNRVSFSDAFTHALVATFFLNLVVYGVVVSVSHALHYQLRSQEREVRAAELERRLVQAKLQALQMQLNPHFLFNTLHAISALMHKDVEAADRMIVRLSDLLRLALESADTQEVSLKEELDFLRRYLEIEQSRFGERLAVSLDVAPAALDALVPNLVLQPLVENAIRHGVEPHARKGRIELSARRAHDTLELQVNDNGDGLQGALHEGIGLSNTRARLRELYGDRQHLELTNGPAGGLRVRVTLPFRTNSPGAGDRIPAAANSRVQGVSGLTAAPQIGDVGGGPR